MESTTLRSHSFILIKKKCLIYKNVNISIAILPVKNYHECLHNFVNYLFRHSPEDKVHIIVRVTNLNGYPEIVF